MKFNINDYVRIKLTDAGKEILLREKRKLPEEDEQGYSKWQMWLVMRVFGEYIFLGCDPPFDLTIDIEPQ